MKKLVLSLILCLSLGVTFTYSANPTLPLLPEQPAH